MSRVSEFDPENLTYGSDNEESRERLRELMLFVAERCQDDPKFGVTKLNKILFYCDFLAFAKYGKSITGISYNKLSFGPVPTGAENMRRRMVQDEDIVVSSRGYSPFQAQRVVPRREANLDFFSGHEIALVDGIIGVLAPASAKQVSELSHGKAWEVVKDHERIPYEAALLSDASPNEEDLARAHELIAAGEWED